MKVSEVVPYLGMALMAALLATQLQPGVSSGTVEKASKFMVPTTTMPLATKFKITFPKQPSGNKSEDMDAWSEELSDSAYKILDTRSPDRQGLAKEFVGRMQKAVQTLWDSDASSFQKQNLLGDTAMVAVYAGELKYATVIGEAMIDAAKWRFPTGVDGDSLHDGHNILGMVAVREGKLDSACAHLLHSVDSFSPVTGSFGPRMRLADELLDKGRFAEVSAYFERCKEGWSFAERNGVDGWIKAVQAKKKPTGDDWQVQLYYL